MTIQLMATIVVRLAPEALAQAQQIQEISAAWNTFLGGIIATKSDISLQPMLTIAPVEEPRVRRRRGRPRLSIAEPPTAA